MYCFLIYLCFSLLQIGFFLSFLQAATYIICIFKVLEDGKVHDPRDPRQPLGLGPVRGPRAVPGHALPAVQQRRPAGEGTCLSVGV